MALELQNLENRKTKLLHCDTSVFNSVGDSFRFFLARIKVNSFRHLVNVEVDFQHPVTAISGSNRVGKTSLLLLIACSHENFLKVDSTSPASQLREHTWNDVLAFTNHENPNQDYSYVMDWRLGRDNRNGEGKKLANGRAWSGLAKRSSDPQRVNAKVRDRHVRFIDLERVLPGRSFSNTLYRKANLATASRLNEDIEQAFSYIFSCEGVKISEVGTHINKTCYLIHHTHTTYSSFNAASGEEAVICLLKDVFECPKDSLVLIDEVEAGFHPSIQRRLADIIQYVSWRDKKQFIITTHSPTLLSAFPSASRRFIERKGDEYRVIKGISHQAARSKMDAQGYPLFRLYCEDDLAKFLVQKILIEIARHYKYFDRLVDVITSGPINQVKNDYVRHKRNIQQYRNPIGYCAVFDGDHKDHPEYSTYFDNVDEQALFMYPYDAPERFLVRAFVGIYANEELSSALVHSDHHSLFQKMVALGLAADKSDARNQCYEAFTQTNEYTKHRNDLVEFLLGVATEYSSDEKQAVDELSNRLTAP